MAGIAKRIVIVGLVLLLLYLVIGLVGFALARGNGGGEGIVRGSDAAVIRSRWF